MLCRDNLVCEDGQKDILLIIRMDVEWYGQ